MCANCVMSIKTDGNGVTETIPDTLCVYPSGPLCGTLQIPGDKSISHRALILASIAEGRTRIRGLLAAADIHASLSALRQLGVGIQWQGDELQVSGVGLRGLRAASTALDMGNSGTAARLFAGLLCAQGFASRLIGDDSLQSRPMARVVQPLCAMGADITASPSGTLPLDIGASSGLQGLTWRPEFASAQLKSAILLAGLYARGETTVVEIAPTRDHTERLLRRFGHAPMIRDDSVRIASTPRLQGCELDVPADISSAAFFMVAATLVPGSDLYLPRVGVNPRRIGVIDILRRMGADIRLCGQHECSGEPVADIHVVHAPLRGIAIPVGLVPGAIDEFPAILVAAAHARGTTVLDGAGELRVKESDRIAAMANGLSSMGINTQVMDDGMVVEGGQAAHSGEVDSCGDHRIAMAFAVAGAASVPVRIDHCANVATSFPGFVDCAIQAGMDIRDISSGWPP